VPAVVALSIFGSPIMPLIDNSVLEALGDRRREYGKLRLWGAVGWGVAAPLVGRLIGSLGLRVSFVGYAILMGGCLLVSLRVTVSRSSIGRDLGRGLHGLFRQGQWVMFLGGILIGGASLAAVHNYLFLYMDELGASELVMGVALSCATLGELSVFYYADRILARLGARRTILLALLAHAIRVLAYSVIRRPLLVLPVQLLHGLSFSALWVASVSYANELAPEGMGATALGMLNSVFFGIGGSLGALLGGAAYDRWGSPVMFRLSALCALGGGVAFLIVRPGSSRRRDPSKG
jgi:PPP family 3-phenylpropionic acid transporter